MYIFRNRFKFLNTGLSACYDIPSQTLSDNNNKIKSPITRNSNILAQKKLIIIWESNTVDDGVMPFISKRIIDFFCKII
jgi:hypothetical protein